MKVARIYKVKIRDNILKQMLLTEKNIAISIIIIVSGVIYLISKNLQIPTSIVVFATIILLMAIFIVLTAKIDNQATYIIVKRFIKYLFRKKELRN